MSSQLRNALIELTMGNQSDKKAIARLEKVADFSVDEMVNELDRLENADAIAREVLRSPRKFSPLKATATVIAAACSVGTMALLLRPEYIPVGAVLGSGIGFGITILREEE